MKTQNTFTSFVGSLNEKSDDNFTETKTNKTTLNFEIYEEIIQVYPHMQGIIEDGFKVGSPEYVIRNIRDAGKYIVFYFNQSCGISFKRLSNDLTKYGVSFQLPGNTDYNFSISIDKK
jgi:hypothetical protein